MFSSEVGYDQERDGDDMEDFINQDGESCANKGIKSL
jgi:hypothetical protein